MNLLPNEDELWRGIGGTFDSFTEVICELIDNSIANIRANNGKNKEILIPTIIIKVWMEEDLVCVTVEDNGTGIKSIESAFRLGDKSGQEDTLNEHGFGLKHSLASANPDNDNWAIFTRTDSDIKNNNYRCVEAPYRFYKEIKIKDSIKEKWPGVFNESGTLIKFRCKKEFFYTLSKGIQGKAGFDRCIEYLKEDIGYTYATTINKSEISIVIIGEK